MGSNNNNVGQNQEIAKFQDDIQFDLAPTTGADSLFGLTGEEYDIADLKAIVAARGATYRKDGTPFVVADDIIEVEVDLKPMGGEGIHEGDSANPISVATSSEAVYQNNGGWTNIDSGGSREDGEDNITTLPTSVDKLFVQNGSIVTVHITFQKI